MWIRPVSPLCLLLICFLIFRCDREESGPDKPGPFEVTVEVINFSCVILHWTSSPGADRYDVFLETDLIAGNIKSDSVKLENLIGEISYSGYVVAIDSKGQRQITTYSFETKIPQLDDREYILPKHVFYTYEYSGPSTFIDSVWIDYTYLSDGRLDVVSQRKKRTASSPQANFEYSYRFEFAYLGRSMVINNYDNNTDGLRATIRLGFNNQSYILPEYYGISRFPGDKNSFDSAVFTYAKNFYIDSVTYYYPIDDVYPSDVRVSHFYSNSSNSFYNGQLEFTDIPAPFQQINGFSDFFGLVEFGYENPLIYPLRMFRSPPTLLARRLSGDLPYKYTFENEKLSSIEYSPYGSTGDGHYMHIFFEY
jgi:hypothetical protein